MTDEKQLGIRVESVKPGSIAAKAGIAVGTWLTKLDVKPVYSPSQFAALFMDYHLRRSLRVARERGGQHLDRPCRLGGEAV